MNQESMLNNIIQLAAIGQLSVDRLNATNAAKHVKDTYYSRLHAFGPHEGRIDPRDPACAEIIEFSKKEYAAYLAAKRRIYNIQRRIDCACMKVVV